MRLVLALVGVLLLLRDASAAGTKYATAAVAATSHAREDALGKIID